MSRCTTVGQWSKADFSAIIEHTNRVIYLEDDDVASVVDGGLSLHRVRSSSSANDTQVCALFIITAIQVKFSVTSAKSSSSFSRLWKVPSTALCRKRSSSSLSQSSTLCEDACPSKRYLKIDWAKFKLYCMFIVQLWFRFLCVFDCPKKIARAVEFACLYALLGWLFCL